MSSLSEPLAGVAAAFADIDGIEALPCDGLGHPLEDAMACLHLRCSLPSPRREEMLGWLGSLVRRAQFVMAALIDRRDLYQLGLKPSKRGVDVAEAAAKLEALLRDPAQRGAVVITDRRGR